MKLPKPRKLPSGKWFVQTMIDKQRVSKTFDTEEDALYWAAGLKAKASGADTAQYGLTVDKAMELYIDERAAVLSPSTVRGYKALRKNNYSLIKNARVRDLTQRQVQKWANDLSANHAPKTVANAHGFLSAVLAEFRPGFSMSTALPKKVKPDIKIPTEAEIKAIIEKARGTRYELPIRLAAEMGMRCSEIRGLSRNCLNADGYIDVRTAVVDGEAGAVEKSTKTYSGTRTLHAPEDIQKLINAVPEDQKALVDLSGQAIYKGFCRICEKAGVQHYRFHDLRHYYASAMLAIGVPDKYAMENMGHATNNMLKAVYQHTIEEQKKNYNKKIEEYFNGLLK